MKGSPKKPLPQLLPNCEPVRTNPTRKVSQFRGAVAFLTSRGWHPLRVVLCVCVRVFKGLTNWWLSFWFPLKLPQKGYPQKLGLLELTMRNKAGNCDKGPPSWVVSWTPKVTKLARTLAKTARKTLLDAVLFDFPCDLLD